MTGSLIAERQTLGLSMLSPRNALAGMTTHRTNAPTQTVKSATNPGQGPLRAPRVDPVQELDLLGLRCPTWSPVDAWLRLEDICWRLRHQGLRIRLVGRTLQVLGFKGTELPADLRRAVLDTDTYAWSVGLERGAVVCTLDYEGLDLVLMLPTEQQLYRVPEGQTVIQLRAAFSIALVRRGLQ